MKKILLINGPNINLLGKREPDIYGHVTYAELLLDIKRWSNSLGLETKCVQSNHEGVIVDYIQSAMDMFDGIVINPAAFTHTSISIYDCLKAVGIPAIEVHISDPTKRETFRHISFAGMACLKTIEGRGLKGYKEALEFLADYLKDK